MKALSRQRPSLFRGRLILKIALATLIPVAAAAGLAFFWGYREDRKAIERFTVHEQRDHALALATAIEVAGDQADVRSIVANYLWHVGAEDRETPGRLSEVDLHEIFVVDAAGVVLAGSRPETAGQPLGEAMGHGPMGLRAVLSGKEASATEFTAGREGKLIHTSAPLHLDPRDRTRVTGAVHLMESYALLEEALLPGVWRRAAVAFTLTLALVAALAFTLGWLVVAPVRRLAEGMRRAEEGQDVTVPVTSRDEIGDLTRSFNQMLAELNRKATTLATLYAIDRTLSQSLDLEVVLTQVLEKICEAMAVEAGGFYLLEADGETLNLRVHRGLSPAFADAISRLRPGEGVSGQAIALRRPVAVDVADYPTPRLAPILKAEGIKYMASAPVISRGKVLGAINVGSQRGHPFTAEELDLLGSIGQQVGASVENARLFAETQQRAAELETFREIDQAITARLELSAVLEAVVAGAIQLLGTQHAQIILWDEGTQGLRYGAALGTEAERVRNQKFELGRGINGIVAQTRQPMVLDDYQASAYALPEFPDIMATITIPILFEDRLLGVLHAHTTRPGKRFTPDDLRRFQMLAGQAAIAIEHARLYDATVRQLRELRALHDTGLAIISSLTLDEQLEVLVQRLGQAAQAQRILVALLDPGNPERFHQCLAHDATRADPWLRHLNLSSGRYPEIQEAVRMGRPLVIPDVPAEARLDAIRNHLKHLDLRSLIVVPLIVQERAIGAVSLGYVGQGRTFPPEEISLLQSFAAQAAIAIEKARLYEEIQQHAAELEERVHERTRELGAANEQLQVASRHKSEFLANMSHELRTPLNSIIGFAELIGEQRVGPLNEKQARYLGHIHTSGKHLLQLISDILDLSKVEAGKFVLQPEVLPVATTLEDILVIARGLANKKQQELSAEIEANLPPLRADPVRFKQILFNLLSNAVKFTPENGTVRVTARRVDWSKSQMVDSSGPVDQLTTRPIDAPGVWLEIKVTDTGIGIKPEDLPRLFQEFVQLESAATKRHEGTGLGLALTKKLVELHGGRIWAASEGEGRGSTFTVLLPFRGPREGQGTSPGPTSSGGREWSEEEAGE